MSETSPRNAPDAGPSPTGRAASGRAGRLVGAAFLFLLLNSAWLRAFPSANLVYVTGVLLHVAAGLALAAGLWFSSRELFRRVRANRWAMVTLSACASLGVVLCVVGATRPYLTVVGVHAACGFGGALLLAFAWRDRRIACCLAAAALLPVYSAARGRWFPPAGQRIVNPTEAPLSMDYEGGGRESPFFPSAAQTASGGKIPSDSSWSRLPAGNATRMSTSSGNPRCTGSLRSTTSFTGSRSNTCKRPRGWRPPSGAPVATTTPCSSTGCSTSRWPGSWTGQRPMPAWPASPATLWFTCRTRWATGGS